MGVIKKSIFLEHFLKFFIMVNHHAKGYFYNEKPRFLHNYANNRFFYFFYFFIKTVLFYNIKKWTTRFWKVFQEKFFFSFFSFLFFMVMLRNKSKKWLFFCHANYIMISSYEKNDFWFFMILLFVLLLFTVLFYQYFMY